MRRRCPNIGKAGWSDGSEHRAPLEPETRPNACFTRPRPGGIDAAVGTGSTWGASRGPRRSAGDGRDAPCGVAEDTEPCGRARRIVRPRAMGERMRRGTKGATRHEGWCPDFRETRRGWMTAGRPTAIAGGPAFRLGGTCPNAKGREQAIETLSPAEGGRLCRRRLEPVSTAGGES